MNNKYAIAGSSFGFATGIGYAIYKKTGFWKGWGYAILGSLMVGGIAKGISLLAEKDEK